MFAMLLDQDTGGWIMLTSARYDMEWIDFDGSGNLSLDFRLYWTFWCTGRVGRVECLCSYLLALD